MPGLRTNRFVDLMFLNKSYWRIHRAMDKPVKYLGRTHRVLFHDPISALAIAENFYPGDPDAQTAALLHIEYDMICSADPDYKRQLERDARLYKASSKREGVRRKRATRDCIYRIRDCPCFIYRYLVITNPGRARKMCPRLR